MDPLAKRRSPRRTPFFCVNCPRCSSKGALPAMKRRTFLGRSIAAGFAAAFNPARAIWAAPPAHNISRIGLQLYTVRDQMKEDFEGTLAKVAQIGYKEVEFAGYFEHSPKDVRAMLD